MARGRFGRGVEFYAQELGGTVEGDADSRAVERFSSDMLGTRQLAAREGYRGNVANPMNDQDYNAWGKDFAMKWFPGHPTAAERLRTYMETIATADVGDDEDLAAQQKIVLQNLDAIDSGEIDIGGWGVGGGEGGGED